MDADRTSESWRFDAIGAPWRIDTPAPIPDAARAAVAERIARFDRDWSRFRPDSLVSLMASEPGRYRLPREAAELLGLYRDLYEATGGRVSPLVGRALEELGYDAAYRLVPSARRSSVPTWADALAWDGEHLDLLRPAMLDVGAAGKGLLVDLVSDVLSAQGVPDHVVDASGDLVRRGAGSGAPERIALEHPADPAIAVGVVDLDQGALCASAVNRRAWADVHHVLDATTGTPTREVIATWAVVRDAAPGSTTRSAMAADGLATGLFFEPGDRLAAAVPDGSGFEWVRMFADGRLESSPSFSGEVFR